MAIMAATATVTSSTFMARRIAEDAAAVIVKGDHPFGFFVHYGAWLINYFGINPLIVCLCFAVVSIILSYCPSLCAIFNAFLQTSFYFV